MSNQGGNGLDPQMAQGQQAEAQRTYAALITRQPYSGFVRPEHIPSMPHIDDSQKTRYVAGVKQMWSLMVSNPTDSDAHKKAAQRLFDATGKLQNGMKQWHQQRAAQSKPEEQPSQPQAQQPVAPAAAAAKPQVQGQPGSQANQQTTSQGQQRQPGPSEAIINHIKAQTFYLAPDVQPGTPEADKALKELRATYMQALIQQENGSSQLAKMAHLAEERQKIGQELPSNFNEKKGQIETALNNCKKYIGNFRQQQQMYKAMFEKKQQSQVKVEASEQAKPAIQAQSQARPVQAVAQPNKTASPATSALPQKPIQAQQTPNSSQPAPPSAHPNGQPIPLSAQAAISAAQRSYQQPASQPQSAVNTSFTSAASGQQTPVNSVPPQGTMPKMPISKNLNVSAPQPVQLGQSRPSLAAPNSGPGGVMGQPVIGKPPQANALDGESAHLLSKNKLYELVRQVTGGEGSDEDLLSPEVEELIINFADDFVDDVITQAAMLAKSRDHNVLELRDVQLVLERNFNIRIPGYATDEVRTVRKFNPAPGWTQKMNAVQAAKVMGGKTDL